MNVNRAAVVALIAAPLVVGFAGSASAGRTWAAVQTTAHTDPCPGAHVQVWAEVGNDGAGQATDHFVCGQVGKDGKDGADGKDSTVPGPKGEKGDAGKDGAPGAVGAPGAPGAPGVAGADSMVPGPMGPAGPVGESGLPGAHGLKGDQGPRGPEGDEGDRGATGKPGVNKTVVVNADGTTETVDGLPKTGGDGKAIVLGTIGVFLLISGGSAMWIYRRRQQ